MPSRQTRPPSQRNFCPVAFWKLMIYLMAHLNIRDNVVNRPFCNFQLFRGTHHDDDVELKRKTRHAIFLAASSSIAVTCDFSSQCPRVSLTIFPVVVGRHFSFRPRHRDFPNKRRCFNAKVEQFWSEGSLQINRKRSSGSHAQVCLLMC